MSAEIDNLSPYSERLLNAVVDAVPRWVDSMVRKHVRRHVGVVNEDVVAAIILASNDARRFVADELFALLSTDVDEQRSNPLQVLRNAAQFPTRVLIDAGVPAPQRDHFDEQINPQDVYGLGPYTWRDLGEDVHDAGIEWGAWKAATILARRRAEGKTQ